MMLLTVAVALVYVLVCVAVGAGILAVAEWLGLEAEGRPPRCRLCGKPLGCGCPKLPIPWGGHE